MTFRRFRPNSRSMLGLVAGLGAVAIAIPSAATAVPDAREQPRDGAASDGYVIAQQPFTPIFEPAPGVIAGNAFASAIDGVGVEGDHRRTVLMSWQSNEDVGEADTQRTLIRSIDGGYTFPSGHTDSIAGFYRKLHDGNVLGVEFIPDSVQNEHQATLVQRRSRDGGATWKAETSTFTTDKTFDPDAFNRGLRVHGGLLEDPQGNLLLTYYTKYTEDSAGSAEIAISKDKGRSWERLSTIFPADGDRAFNEVGISWATDGDLVAVVRSHVGSALSGLYTARSSDQGHTWSTPQPINITTASGEPAPTTGVMPILGLLPNGVMTLTFGRPDNWVAISPDGTGREFEQAQVSYQNFPDQDLGAFQRNHGSSGNGSHVVVASNRILQVGDNCAPTWGCPATDAGWTTDGKYRVWKKFIDVLTPDPGKIDLKRKYDAGAITVDTTMTHTNRKLPEMGPAGALDGSTDWASSAVDKRNRNTGTYTLNLDRTYLLTRAGLSLHPGLPSSATVQVSTDGTNWTEVIDTGAIRSYALSYYPLDKVPAKFVRVTVDDPNLRPGGAFLNEIELYSTTNSFENDAVDTVPRGYTNAIGATVVDHDTDGDGHAMRLADAWNDATARATWVSPAAATQNLEFRFTSMGYARTLQFITNGVTQDGATVNAFQLAKRTDGSLAYYDTAAKAWNTFTDPGLVPEKEWHTVRVEATLTGATVYLDGDQVGTVPLSTAGVTGLTGHTFTTTGTAPSYDNFVIDDVTQSSG